MLVMNAHTRGEPDPVQSPPWLPANFKNEKFKPSISSLPKPTYVDKITHDGKEKADQTQASRG
jgi:hypothetical protein